MNAGADPYDPQAPEDQSPGRSAYFTRKEIRTLGIVLLVVFLLLLPVYNLLKRRSEKSICSRNMGKIAQAIGFYAVDNDDRYPPLYSTVAGGSAPGPGENSPWPSTWGGSVARYMQRGSLVCPSAQPTEIVETAHPEKGGQPLRMTYGMYTPYGAYARSSVENPDQVILIAETSNLGAEDTYDPLPFPGGDAFVIGWDNDNLQPNASTQFVTRLAFPESKGGQFRETGPTRHDKEIHALSAAGSLQRLKPNMARVEIVRSLGLPGGMWAAPARSRRSRP